jgi:single-stranded DNA-binding protein
MSINRTILSGTIGQYGVKITWTDMGKALINFTLVCEEPGQGENKTPFKTFIPVVIVGPQADTCTETLEPGDTMLIGGKVASKAGKMKDSGQVRGGHVRCQTPGASGRRLGSRCCSQPRCGV